MVSQNRGRKWATTKEGKMWFPLRRCHDISNTLWLRVHGLKLLHSLKAYSFRLYQGNKNEGFCTERSKKKRLRSREFIVNINARWKIYLGKFIITIEWAQPTKEGYFLTFQQIVDKRSVTNWNICECVMLYVREIQFHPEVCAEVTERRQQQQQRCHHQSVFFSSMSTFPTSFASHSAVSSFNLNSKSVGYCVYVEIHIRVFTTYRPSSIALSFPYSPIPFFSYHRRKFVFPIPPSISRSLFSNI